MCVCERTFRQSTASIHSNRLQAPDNKLRKQSCVLLSCVSFGSSLPNEWRFGWRLILHYPPDSVPYIYIFPQPTTHPKPVICFLDALWCFPGVYQLRAIQRRSPEVWDEFVRISDGDWVRDRFADVASRIWPGFWKLLKRAKRTKITGGVLSNVSLSVCVSLCAVWQFSKHEAYTLGVVFVLWFRKFVRMFITLTSITLVTDIVIIKLYSYRLVSTIVPYPKWCEYSAKSIKRTTRAHTIKDVTSRFSYDELQSSDFATQNKVDLTIVSIWEQWVVVDALSRSVWVGIRRYFLLFFFIFFTTIY